MELLLSLSKESSNSVASMLPLPMHIVYGMYNTLSNIFKKEKEEQDKASKAEQDKYNIPSISSLQSSTSSMTSGVMNSVGHYGIPSMGSFNIPH